MLLQSIELHACAIRRIARWPHVAMPKSKSAGAQERMLPGNGAYTCAELVEVVRLEQEAQQNQRAYKRYIRHYVREPSHDVCRRCAVAHHPHLPCVVSSDDERESSGEEDDPSLFQHTRSAEWHPLGNPGGLGWFAFFHKQ